MPELTQHIAPSPAAPQRSPARMQRKCACGGTPGPTGECAACRKKRKLQPKLYVNQPGDRYEQEADRVADQVMRSAAPAQPRLPITPLVQREGDGTMAAAPPVVDQVLATPGQAMDGGTRGFMEQRFGYDFSRVRIHTSGQAARSAVAVQARAYTVGSDVVFAQGQYRPSTTAGRRLLAHELTHVVQQGSHGGMLQRSESPTKDWTVPPPPPIQFVPSCALAQQLCHLNLSPDCLQLFEDCKALRAGSTTITDLDEYCLSDILVADQGLGCLNAHPFCTHFMVNCGADWLDMTLPTPSNNPAKALTAGAAAGAATGTAP